MSKIKIISIVALVLLLIGIVGSILTVRTIIEAKPVSDQKVFEDDNIKNLEIKADNATLQVIPANDSKVRVELSGEIEKSRDYSFEADVEGDTLAVNLNESLHKYFNFNLRFNSKGLIVSVYVPKKEYDSLNIEALNGRINAENVKFKDVKIDTINGTVDLKKIKASSTSVSTSNGIIVLDDIVGGVSVETTNGKILFVTNDLDRNIDLETVNGSIEIKTEKQPSNATVDVEVVNGKVDIFDESDRHTVFGDGKNKINLKTVNGKVTIK